MKEWQKRGSNDRSQYKKAEWTNGMAVRKLAQPNEDQPYACSLKKPGEMPGDEMITAGK
jgi:hypothetical protein